MSGFALTVRRIAGHSLDMTQASSLVEQLALRCAALDAAHPLPFTLLRKIGWVLASSGFFETLLLGIARLSA